MKLTRHIEPRDIPSGFILNDKHSYLSFIIPEDGTNLFYLGANGMKYTEGGIVSVETEDTIMSTTTFLLTEPHKAFVPIYETLKANTVYTVSFWVKRKTPLNTIQAYVGTSTNDNPTVFDVSLYGQHTFNITDHWTVCEYQFYTGSNFNPNLNHFIVFKTPDDGVVKIDGIQLEEKPYRTTYINGYNYAGNQNYYWWDGQPNNSVSHRSAHLSGGRVVNFADIGLHIISIEGLGLPDFNHVSVDLPLNPIELYQQSLPEQRDITVDFIYYANGVEDMLSIRHQLVKQLKSGKLAIQIQFYDCDDPVSEIYEAIWLYDGGLELKLETLYGEKVSLDFTTYDPYFYKIGINSRLFSILNSSSGQFAAKINNEWTHIDAPTVGIFSKIIVGSDNNIYLLNREPSNGQPFLWRYKPLVGTWEPLLSSFETNQYFYDMVMGPFNNIHFVGKFKRIGYPSSSVMNVPDLNFARYNIYTTEVKGLTSSIFSIAGFNTASVHKIILLKNGKMVLGGNFNRISHINDVVFGPKTVYSNHIVIYNPSGNNFEPVVGSGISSTSGTVYALAEYENTLYVGGNFTDTTASNLLCVLNFYSSDYTQRVKASCGVINGTVYSLLPINDKIYVGGNFVGNLLIPGSETVQNYLNGILPVSLAKINPHTKTIEGIKGGTVLNFASTTEIAGTIYGMSLSDNNKLWVYGNFDYYGDLYLNGFNNPENNLFANLIDSEDFKPNCSSIAIYDIINDKWDIPDIIYNENRVIRYILLASGTFIKDINLQVLVPRYPTANTQQYNAFNEIEININEDAIGSSPVILLGPVLFTGTYRLRSISNLVTNQSLYFNRELFEDELYKIDLTQLLPKVTSSLYGNLNGQLLFGSNPKNFMLISGRNVIKVSAEYDISRNPLMFGLIAWREKYIYIESIVNKTNEY